MKMKIKLVWLIILCLISLNSNCQTNLKDYSNFGKDKNFQVFLDKFYPIMEFPFNRKRIDQYLVENGLYKGLGITEEESKKYLNKTDTDLKITILGYNENGEIASSVEEEKYIYKGQRILINNYLAIITEESPDRYSVADWETGDTSYYCLRIFNSDAKVIDYMIIGGYNDKNKDYKDVIFLDRNHFRIFSYVLNENNIIKGRIIDKTKPITYLYTSDYEISMSNGKILSLNQPEEPIGLFSYVIKYMKNSVADDPMNSY
jgi:hypothetical protein